MGVAASSGRNCPSPGARVTEAGLECHPSKPKLAEHPLSRPMLLGCVIYISSLKANMGRTQLALISHFRSFSLSLQTQRLSLHISQIRSHERGESGKNIQEK